MAERIPFTFWKIVSIPFVLVGACAVFMSIAILVKTAVFHTKSTSTTGVILRVEPRPGRSIQHAPIYSFRDSSGNSHQNEGILCGKDRWHEGQSILVRFDPNNADDSKLDCFHDIWMPPLFFSAFSTLYFFVMWMVLRSSSKSRWLSRSSQLKS
jgi:hypothetical protein